MEERTDTYTDQPYSGHISHTVSMSPSLVTLAFDLKGTPQRVLRAHARIMCKSPALLPSVPPSSKTTSSLTNSFYTLPYSVRCHNESTCETRQDLSDSVEAGWQRATS